jgi:hypothetical protein
MEEAYISLHTKTMEIIGDELSSTLELCKL